MATMPQSDSLAVSTGAIRRERLHRSHSGSGAIARTAARIGFGLLGLPLAGLVAWGLWAAITWIGYGHLDTRDHEDPLVDAFMPHHEVREYQQRIVAAPPSVVFAAAQHFRLTQSPIIRALIWTRAGLLRAPEAQLPDEPLVDEALKGGWSLLATEPGHQLVF